MIETTQYTKELEESDDDDAEDRLQNIDELISKVVSFEQEREELGEEASLSAFLEEVALVADIDGVDKDDNKVLLMTLHSAKGLRVLPGISRRYGRWRISKLYDNHIR